MLDICESKYKRDLNQLLQRNYDHHSPMNWNCEQYCIALANLMQKTNFYFSRFSFQLCGMLCQPYLTFNKQCLENYLYYNFERMTVDKQGGRIN